MVKGNGLIKFISKMRNVSPVIVKISQISRFKKFSFSLPIVLTICILIGIIPFVHQRAFIRCYFEPNGATQSLESLKARLLTDKSRDQYDIIIPPKSILPVVNADTATAEAARLPPLITPTREQLKASASIYSGDAEIELDPREFDTAELFKRIPSEVSWGSKVMKDRGYPRTRCFSSDGKTNLLCAPAVIVAGYEKCGTSALYFKLSKHPEIVSHPFKKEYCPDKNSSESTWEWISSEHMPRLIDSTGNSLLLNGCIGILTKSEALKELQRISPDLKVLVSLRNYADWAYSYYSYRCMPGFDEGCEKLKAPNSKGPWKENRTPGNFSKIVMEVEHNQIRHNTFGIIRPDVELYRPWLEKLTKIVKRNSLMIVKQEDLSFHPRETLAEISRFIGIDSSSFPESTYTLVSNTNDRPSQFAVLDKSASKKDVAAMINSGSIIYNDTRESLNKFWKKECEWLRERFELHFKEAC